MQAKSQHPEGRSPSRASLIAMILLAAAGMFPHAASGQTLARPGWAGSGMNLESWWTHTVFYQVDPHGFRSVSGEDKASLRGLTSQLDYVHSLGVDAVTLTHFMPEQGDLPGRVQSIDPAVGSMDDFDDLVREASRDSLRLLVELDPRQTPDPAVLAAAGRFWLGRGAAGIVLKATDAAGDAQRSAQLHRLREVTRGFAGQRILIDEQAPGEAGAGRHGEADLVLSPTLAMVPTLSASALRGALEHLQGMAEKGPLIAATDAPGIARSATRFNDGANNAALAKVIATLLLGTRANAQLYFGQEIGLTGSADASTRMAWGTPVDPAAKKPKVEPQHGPEVAAEEADPDSLLNWYRRLIDLHHGNAVLRSGSSDLLNHDDQNSIVWVSRKGAVTPLSPAIVVACNLSDKPVTLSLTADMAKLHLRGSFLRTVLRSDNGMGGLSLNAVTLPAYGVYIGEIRF